MAASEETPLQRKLREHRERSIRVDAAPQRVRYAEFATPVLPRVVETMLAHLLLGAVLTFLVGLLPLLVLEEDAIRLAPEWRQLDALGRYGVGIAFLLAIALVLPLMAANFWASLSMRRAIEAAAPGQPDLVASPAQLARDPDASRQNLRVALFVFCGILGVVGGFLFVFGLVSLADEVPDAIQPVWIGAGLLVLAGLCLLATLALRRATPALSPRKTWSGDLARVGRDTLLSAEAQQHRPLPGWLRGWRTLAGLLSAVQYGLISLTSLFTVIGVMTRQPCRFCEQRTFGPGIEANLDRFWLLVLGMALASAVVIVVQVLVAIIASVATRRELLGRIDAGEAELARPPDAVLRDVVAEASGPWARLAHLTGMWTVGPLLVGLVWWLVGFAGHTVYADHAGFGWALVWVGVGLFAVTLLAVALDETTDPARRDRVREAWPVVDKRAAGQSGRDVPDYSS